MTYEPTPITAPPTYETLKALWLGHAPTAGASERYDREVNFEAWAHAHGIFPEGSVEPSWHVEDNITGQKVSRTYATEEQANGACRALNMVASGGRYGVYNEKGERA